MERRKRNYRHRGRLTVKVQPATLLNTSWLALHTASGTHSVTEVLACVSGLAMAFKTLWPLRHAEETEQGLHQIQINSPECSFIKWSRHLFFHIYRCGYFCFVLTLEL